MVKETNSRIRIISVIVCIALVVSCAFTLAKFGEKKANYEACITNHDLKIESQIKSVEDNKSALKNAENDIEVFKMANDESSKQVSDKKNQLMQYENLAKGKVCYLTFDDGPSNNTLEILKVLKKYNVKATFFVTANGINKYMKNIVEEGHTIALHTYCHEYSKIYASVDAYFDDLNKIHDLVKKETGVDSRVIRFPGGSSNTISRSYCSGIMSVLTKKVIEEGYQYFDWNADSTDANRDGQPVETLVSHVNADAKGMDSITVLMHDTDAKKTTAQALPQIIENLREKGFAFDKLTVNSPAVHHSVNN